MTTISMPSTIEAIAAFTNFFAVAAYMGHLQSMRCVIIFHHNHRYAANHKTHTTF